MPFTRAAFTLSWFALPDAQDWRNLNLSGVGRVMLPYGMAKSHRDVLAHLGATGKRVVIRIEEEQRDDPGTIAFVLRGLKAHAPIDAVILGNEPDLVPTPVDFTDASPDWQAERAYRVKARTDVWRAAVRSAGLTPVAPALSHPPEVISEDGEPQPGRVTWREILAPSNSICDGEADHCGYVLGWQSGVDRLRFKFGLKRAAEAHHKPVWIAEGTYPTADDMAQMACAIEQADILLTHPAGGRVEMYAPFCSTGTPGGHWPEGYLLKDERAYIALGNWMRQA